MTANQILQAFKKREKEIKPFLAELLKTALVDAKILPKSALKTTPLGTQIKSIEALRETSTSKTTKTPSQIKALDPTCSNWGIADWGFYDASKFTYDYYMYVADDIGELVVCVKVIEKSSKKHELAFFNIVGFKKP